MLNEADPRSQEHIRRWGRERLNQRHTAFYDVEAARAGGTSNTESRLEAAAGNRRLVAISSNANRGFAGGHNLAINYALHRPRPADWVFHLNDDAVLEDESLDEVLRGEREFEATTLLVPEFEDTPAIYRLSWPLGRGEDDFRSADTDRTASAPSWWVSGSALLIPAALLWKLKEHDGYWWNEDYYLYMEDVELSLRVQRADGKAVVADGLKVAHSPASSSGGEFSAIEYYYSCRNRKHLLRDWTSGWTKPLAFVASIAADLIRASRNLLAGRVPVAGAVLLGSVAGFRGETGKAPMHDRLAGTGQ